jgi:hypothetical protein
MIIGSKDQTIEGIIRDLKRHTSNEALSAIEVNQQEGRRGRTGAPVDAMDV